MSLNTLFSSFIKIPDSTKVTGQCIGAVKYRRVSSKEQFDNNCSIDFQDKFIMEFANRVNMPIYESFGGTYESAKTDGRKEFNRMLEYVKRNKSKISHILVYSNSRFSRTGGEAIKIVTDLRRKYGVILYSVTQPVDVTNEAGVMHQNLDLLFCHYDNVTRTKTFQHGIISKLSDGYWAKMAPLGYEFYVVNPKQKILKINAKGRLIRQAFEWKAGGMKSEAILEKLAARGMKITKQHLSKIFSNIIYCGLVTDKRLKGKVIDGKHEPLISKDLFLRVNNIKRQANKFGTHHQSENENIPLKVITRCPKCGKGYTGYIVKAKNLYYYKCTTKGCRVSISAKQLNGDFLKYLEQYSLKPELFVPLLDDLKAYFKNLLHENTGTAQSLKSRLADLEKQTEKLEEKYFLFGEMEREQFQKWHGKLGEEKGQILKEMKQMEVTTSNLESYLETAVSFSSKLPLVWSSTGVIGKEKIQKLLFPAGIVYNKENRVFLTTEVNSVIALIAHARGDPGQEDTKKGGLYTTLSTLVRKRRFELPRQLRRYHLKVVRLPISPPPHSF
jgi:site-specific DNA recombinase